MTSRASKHLLHHRVSCLLINEGENGDVGVVTLICDEIKETRLRSRECQDNSNDNMPRTFLGKSGKKFPKNSRRGICHGSFCMVLSLMHRDCLKKVIK